LKAEQAVRQRTLCHRFEGRKPGRRQLVAILQPLDILPLFAKAPRYRVNAACLLYDLLDIHSGEYRGKKVVRKRKKVLTAPAVACRKNVGNKPRGDKQMTDAFDTMFPRRPPMTAGEARAVVAEMQAQTRPAAAVRLLMLAIGPAGNLTDEARNVYCAELDRLTA